MRIFMSTSEFARWAGISRNHVYTIDYQQEFIVRNHKGEIDVEPTVIAICNHYEGKYAPDSVHGKIAASLRGKLETLRRDAKTIYLNSYEVLLKMNFNNVYELYAYQKKHDDFPVGIPSKARSGCAEYLYPLNEIEAHIERNWEALRKPGEKSLSAYWAKLFIRGEFKPVMV